MSNYLRNEKNEERAKKIVSIIKDYDGIISSGEIFTLGGDEMFTSKSGMKAFMRDYVLLYHGDQIKSVPRKGYEYITAEAKKEDKSFFWNSEGYSDPTAGNALANLMMASKESKFRQAPGEIWTYDPGNYKNNVPELALVVAVSKGCVTYLIVKDKKKDMDWFNDECISFEFDGNKCYVDPRYLRYAGQNRFTQNEGCMLDFFLVKKYLAKRFDISVVEKTVKVEVPVEKIKEVPVELTEEMCIEFLENSGWLEKHDQEIINREFAREILIGDGAVPEETEKVGLDISVWKTKAETWETAFRLMCGKEA